MGLRKTFTLLLALCLSGCAAAPAAPTVSAPSAALPTTAATAPQTLPTEATTVATTLPPAYTGITQPEPAEDAFVPVTYYIPDIVTDLRYSTDQNFTGQVIYQFDRVWLRYGTVKKLMVVQQALREKGLGLMIWDGFRPPSAQFTLWEVYPDSTYVANPNKGFSSHSRGNTVDLTLVTSEGQPLVMPTDFDDFSKLADRNYSDCSPEAAENAQLREQLMEAQGFSPYSGEWWHFSDQDSYPVDKSFEPVAICDYYADCNEFISLRLAPDTASETIVKIPAGDRFQVLALHGEYAYVSYGPLLGYVLQSYIRPCQ